jgi:FHS family glucose/mannose:H+ symporter-like MFS transporter
MNGQATLIPVTIASAFVVGMVLALLGSIKLPLAKRLHLHETRVGNLLAALFLAIIPMMLVSGVLIDSWGVQWVLIVGSLLTALGLTALAMSRNYGEALGSVLLIGGSGACLSNASGVLMPAAFFPDNEAASLNLGNVFFGLGALVTPALGELLVERLSYRKAMAVLAMVCLLPALTAIVPADFPQAAGGNFMGVLSSPIVWLAGLAFLVYAPLEGIMATWTTTLMTDLGTVQRRAALALSAFWLAFLAGRLGVVFLEQGALPRGSDPWLVMGLALFAAMALGGLAGAPTGGEALSRLLLVGLFLGPIFPTLVGIVFQKFPDQKGTAFGAMFCIGAVGNLILPPMFGAYARRHSVIRALRYTPVVALVLTGLALVLGLWLQL